MKAQQLRQNFARLGVKESAQFLIVLHEVHASSNLFVELVDEVLADSATPIRGLLRIRHSAFFLRTKLDYLSAPFDALLDDLASEKESLGSSILPLDKEGEDRAREKLESLLRRGAGPIDTGTLSTNIAETYTVCKWVDAFFSRIGEINSKHEFAEVLYRLYSYLYDHILPNHLNDLQNEEENIYSLGLFTSLACYLAEIENGKKTV